jgi:hypothetical protein
MGDENLYRAMGNAPTDWVDPTGRWSALGSKAGGEAGMLYGGAVGGLIGVVIWTQTGTAMAIPGCAAIGATGGGIIGVVAGGLGANPAAPPDVQAKQGWNWGLVANGGAFALLLFGK